MFLHGRGQRGENPFVLGIDGPVLQHGIKLCAKVVEGIEPLLLGRAGPRGVRLARVLVTFVGEVVGGTGEGIDGVDVGTQGGRDQPTHGKILVVGLRKPGATGVGLLGGDRHKGRKVTQRGRGVNPQSTPVLDKEVGMGMFSGCTSGDGA